MSPAEKLALALAWADAHAATLRAERAMNSMSSFRGGEGVARTYAASMLAERVLAEALCSVMLDCAEAAHASAHDARERKCAIGSLPRPAR